MPRYAELHCHSEFSFLDGASSADDLVERAVELGLEALAITDHQGLYGAVRFVTAARAAGIHPVVGVEIELLDAAVPDPEGIVVPARRPARGRGRTGTTSPEWIALADQIEPPGRPGSVGRPEAGRPSRPRAERLRLPGHRAPVREDLRGIGDGQRGPHLVLLARDQSGYRSLSRLVSTANLAGTKGVPRFTHELLEQHTEGLVALSGCRHGEIARRLLAGDREGAALAAARYARIFGGALFAGGGRSAGGGPTGEGRSVGGRSASGRGSAGGVPTGQMPFADDGRLAGRSPFAPGGRPRGHHARGGPIGGFVLELQHHLLPDDDRLVAETVRLADELGLPVVVTNDVHYALPEDRELQDVMVAIRHGLTLDRSEHLRRPNGEYHLKSAEDLLGLPPGDVAADPAVRRAWVEGMANAAELARSCRIDLGFERYRFPGFEVPKGETPISRLETLCHEGARRRYHPLTPRVLSQLAHELDVIERTGLAEFFLICWDLMQFARSRGIPAQGRGSAGDSIVAYVLGITRVDPIRHNLLFERFINEGRTSYPDVDIDFASSRREEVIRYVYERYGPEHTGMVCNVVTYRARSAVREVGYALGFPRPLVDRVAKALETYDSVMVRRDLEADGGFAEFFAPSEPVEVRGQSAQHSAAGHSSAAGSSSAGALTGGRASAAERASAARCVSTAGRVSAVGSASNAGSTSAARCVSTAGRASARYSSVETTAVPQPGSLAKPGTSAAAAGAARAVAAEAARAVAAETTEAARAAGAARAANPAERSHAEPSVDCRANPAASPVAGSTGGRSTERGSCAATAPIRVAGHPQEAATRHTVLRGDRLQDARGPGANRVLQVSRLQDRAPGACSPYQGGDGLGNVPPSQRVVPSGCSVSPAVARALAIETGFVDEMGQLNHARGGRWRRGGRGLVGAGPDPAEHGNGRSVRREDEGRMEGGAGEAVATTRRGQPSNWRGQAGPGRSGSGSERARHVPSDEEGGPGDTPVSIAWLRAGRERGPAERVSAERGPARMLEREPERAPERGQARVLERQMSPVTVSPHSWSLQVADRSGRDPAARSVPGAAIPPRPATRPDPPAPLIPATNPAPAVRSVSATRHVARSSVARLEPGPLLERHAGSTAGLSPWERWLELCARIDGRPRHLGIHVGGMLVTAAPLVEIAPLERATMPGRVVVQYDKRDVETMKLIKLDLLGLRMLSAIDDALRDITADCGVVLDLDRLPEDLPDVFRMIRAADTTGVFQIESRAQMQTLPKSAPTTLDDLVVEVAIIRPGPIQGNAVHPYLRRRQGIDPVTYLHPSLEPILRETLGVILYQEQVMEIAIRIAGFSAAQSDGFRRAMGTWRSSREMEKLHRGFVEGCRSVSGLDEEQAEELFRQVAAFASFGFNKSHAAAFARTAYESAFLKLYYPAQFVTGLINNQPMGFYPVEVLVNDAKRHGVAVLPVDLNRSRYRTTTEWVGMPGEPLPEGCGIDRRPPVVRSSGCVVPDRRTRRQLAPVSAEGYGIRLGLHLVKGIGEEHAEVLDGELERGPYRSLADVVARTGLPEEVLERLIRAGALDSLGRPRRELLWQLREVAASTGRMTVRSAGRASGDGPPASAGRAWGNRPPTMAPPSSDLRGPGSPTDDATTGRDQPRGSLQPSGPLQPCGPLQPSGPLQPRGSLDPAGCASTERYVRSGPDSQPTRGCARVPETPAEHAASPWEVVATRQGDPLDSGTRHNVLPVHVLHDSCPEWNARPETPVTTAALPGILDLGLPPTDAPALPPPTELERLADSYAILSVDARRQVVELFREALDRLGVVPGARLADLRPCRVQVAGLVVTRQHPMTARGTVFLALEDETGMFNVTLWPDRWARFRGVVRRHALLWIDGDLQREGNVVNVVARTVRSLPDVARGAGGPSATVHVRAQGYAGMRRR